MNKLLENFKAAIERDAEEAHNVEIKSLQEKSEADIKSFANRTEALVEAAAAEYIKENEARLVTTEEYARAKSALEGIMEAIESNGFKVDEEAAVNRLKKELEDLKESYNDLFDSLTKTKESMFEAVKHIGFLEKTRGLTESQVLKAEELIEAVQFDSLEEYASGLDMIIENVSNSGIGDGAGVEAMTERQAGDITPSETPEKTYDPVVMSYMQNIAKLNKR